MSDRALAAHEVLALRVAWKLDQNHGDYKALSPSELMVAAFMLTPGSCHACASRRPLTP